MKKVELEDEKMMEAIHLNARKRTIHEENNSNNRKYLENGKRYTISEIIYMIIDCTFDVIIIGLLFMMVMKLWN